MHSDELIKYIKLVEGIQLDEDLGNLKQIEADLRQLFQPFGKKSMLSTAGENSPVELIDVSNGSAMMRAAEEKDTIGLVFVLDGEQIAGVSLRKSGRYGLGGDSNFLLSDRAQRISGFPYKELYNQKFGSSKSAHRNAFVTIKKFAQESGMTFEVKAIKTDMTRVAKQIDRRKSRDGATAMMNPERLRAQIKGELQSKLVNFKASKATSVKEFDDIISAFQDEFLETINVGGYSYQMSNDRLNYGSLKSGGDSWSTSYLTYTMTPDSKEKAYADWKARRTASGDLEGRDDDDRAPSGFEVHLKLGKGRTLEITKVEPNAY